MKAHGNNSGVAVAAESRVAVSEQTIETLLDEIGEDIDRDGLIETPHRAAQAWAEWTSGYFIKPKDILKVFVEHSSDELILVRDIPFYSLCEHHLAPVLGRVHVGYVPGEGRIVGLSKLPRLVDVYARRLQVQERMTVQIAEALEEVVRPQGVGVVVEARHLCMESRGIRRPGTITVTSALRGCIKSQHDARAEFLSLTRSAPNVAV